MLSERGDALAHALPAVVANWELQPTTCFYDASVRRCFDTVSRLPLAHTPYGPGHGLRTLNSVLRTVDSVSLICYRFASIESGDLYHVEDLELHTDVHAADYDMQVASARRRARDVAVVLESATSGWRQTGTLPLAHHHD